MIHSTDISEKSGAAFTPGTRGYQPRRVQNIRSRRKGRDAGQAGWTEIAAPARSVKRAVPGIIPCIGKAEANVVVPVRGRVVVAVGDPRVRRVVVPRPAALDAVGALCRLPYMVARRSRRPVGGHLWPTAACFGHKWPLSGRRKRRATGEERLPQPV